jgi:hypothetical protein
VGFFTPEFWYSRSIDMTARKVVTRSGRGICGYNPSLKMATMIPWESTLERDAFSLFEMSSAVIQYHAQPEKIQFELKGKLHHYFPDARLELSDGTVVYVEIKPRAKLNKPEIKERMEAIRKYYESRPHTKFLILDEHDIRVEPRLTNLKLMACHQSYGDKEEVSTWLQSLHLLTPQTVAGAASVLGDIRIAYRLIAKGFLQCDLSKPLSDNSPVWFAKEGERHDTFFF